MNTKLVLIFLLLFLVMLLLFHYLKINSSIVILLSVVTILLVNYLIINKEYFVVSSDVSGYLKHMYDFLEEKKKVVIQNDFDNLDLNQSLLFEGSSK